MLSLNHHLIIQAREREEFALRQRYSENQSTTMMVISDSPAQITIPNFEFGNKTKETEKKGIVFRWTGFVNTIWEDARNRIKLFMEPAAWYGHTQNYACSLLDQFLGTEIDLQNRPELFIHQTDRGPEYNNKGYLQFLGLMLLTGKITGGILYGRLPAGHRYIFIQVST
jgi:hypothetical protein